MRKLLIALLLLSTPANAAIAKWSSNDTWSVYGDTVHKSCLALNVYSNGRDISIGRDGDGWSIIIGRVSNAPGSLADVAMVTDKGAAGFLLGVGLANNAVAFRSIDPSSLAAFMNAGSVTIEGIGTYSMAGSVVAAKSVLECYKAMQGVDA